MSLEQKVGQMIQAEIQACTPEEVRRYHIGSVLNGGGSWPGERRDAAVRDWVALADAYYEASVADDPAIPVLWGTDAVHGHSNVRGATIFPHNIGLGAANDPELLERIGLITAREVAGTGIDWTFAPTLAVVRDDRWGRTYEGYSEDPEVVRAYAGRMVRSIQGHGPERFGSGHVLACAKHFLADGGTTNGVDQGDTELDEQTLIALHAQGYVTALAEGAQTVMASFSSWNGEKMHGNRYLLTEILRGPLGFDGLVVGDWNGHGQLPGCTNKDSAAAILAGIDLIMVPHDWKAFLENTLDQVRAGDIPLGRIDEAVRRILRVKMRFGLLGPHCTRGRPSTRPMAKQGDLVGCEAHRAIAREAVQKSLVLLKNRSATLPASPASRVLVVGEAADDIGRQSGGWTLTWQGTETTRSDFPTAETLFEGIAACVEAAGGSAVASSDGRTASDDFDLIIAVIGETPYAEGQGDVPDALVHQTQYPNDLALLERVRAAAPETPLVTVFLTGRPTYANPEINRSDAFVVAWLPGGEGGGVADALFGRTPFTGRLTFSWPGEPGARVNRKDGVQAGFPYGFGLDGETLDEAPDLPEHTITQTTETWALPIFVRGTTQRPLQLLARSPSIPDGIAVGTASVSVDTLEVATVDGRLQASAKRVTWSGSGSLVWTGPIPPNTATNVVLRMRVVTGSLAAIRVAVGEAHLSLGTIATTDDRAWQTLRIPLTQFPAVEPSSGTDVFGLHADGDVCIEFETVAWE